MQKIIDWFQKHDKITHFLGCFATTIILGLTVPYGILISAIIWVVLIEGAQALKWGINWKDTIGDWIADLIGLIVAYGALNLLF